MILPSVFTVTLPLPSLVLITRSHLKCPPPIQLRRAIPAVRADLPAPAAAEAAALDKPWAAGGENICSTSNKNYQSGNDYSYQQVKIIEKNVEFKNSFNDVFFVPPDPKTYINNSFSLSASPLAISIGFKGLSCPAYCKTISVFPSGKIDLN